MKLTEAIGYLFAIVLLSGCATTYKPTRPGFSIYALGNRTEGVSFYYKYGILNDGGNKRYVSRELTSQVHVVAVKIVNDSERTLYLNQNCKLMVGDNKIVPLSTKYVAKQVQQKTSYYIPLLFAYVPGFLIGIFNIARVSSANKYFRRDLDNLSLLGKSIAPGQTAYGVMGIQHTGYAPMRLVLTK